MTALAPTQAAPDAPAVATPQTVVLPRLHRSPVARLLGHCSTVMRSLWWRHALAGFGAGSSLARPAHVSGGAGIHIGRRVQIWRHARLDAFRTAEGAARLIIGDDTAIQPHVHIGAAESVRIGRSVLMASHVYITDHDHDWSNPDEPARHNPRLLVAPVLIDDYVWLGERVIVLKGVTIGARSIVGAGSVVTKSIPPLCIAAGAPARVVRRWNPATRSWERP